VTDTLKSVIFDHSVLLRQDASTLEQLHNLLNRLKALGLRITVFSNDPLDIRRELRTRSLPPVDLFMTKEDVGKNKGSHEWVEEAARRLGVKRHQFLYVGDDERDWRTAINSAIFYLHARWVGPIPEGMIALPAPGHIRCSCS
jgi:HAD superfamily hydrolase (TIGR01549 family)